MELGLEGRAQGAEVRRAGEPRPLGRGNSLSKGTEVRSGTLGPSRSCGAVAGGYGGGG